MDQGLDQAGRFADERTGGKFGNQIDSAGDRVRDGLDGLDGKDDDFGTTPADNA
ncbi:MAG: antitoxin [Ornithinimicrobium sp.]|nr:antitoxin [Ornithinimicrobium sp.]MDO5738947.1 antitoxin [Ornithinimicrobium sp.]